MKKILRGFLLVLFILFLGEIVPRFVIATQASEKAGKNGQIFTEYSITEAKNLTGSLENAIITGRKIEDITVNPGDTMCMDYPIVLKGEYEAKIKLYTLFGIPYGEVDVNCQGSSIKRYL